MSDHTSTERHFSRAAARYHARAELQRRVAGTLLSYLSAPMDSPRVLELGCGTGFLTAHLLHALHPARIDAVDISAAMIAQARQSLPEDRRVRWHVCDVWEFQGPGDHDLIASSSSLQWMQPLDGLFSRLARFLKPEGRLLCSVVVEGTLGALHRLRAEIAPRKPPQQPLPSVATILAGLHGAGFQVTQSGQETLHTLHDRVEDLLRSIRELGFTGGPLATSSPPLTRGELRRLVNRYAETCRLPAGPFAAEYCFFSFEAIRIAHT